MTPFIILSSVDSTNNYAMAKLHAGMLEPGTCFLAIEQTAGKGQRGRQWQVTPGENITMSAVLQPFSYKPFLFSAAIALGCYDFIKGLGAENVSVKWPNDIYIGDRKAAGILIENIMKGGRWEWAVVGVGVNLNQEEFEAGLSKAVSLKMATGRVFNLAESGKKLHKAIMARIEWLKGVAGEPVMKEYNSLLYRRGLQVRLKQGAVVFNSVIKEVTDDGMLVTTDALERSFAVGDVEFV